jgi:hypothetical protein
MELVGAGGNDVLRTGARVGVGWQPAVRISKTVRTDRAFFIVFPLP